MRTVIELTFDPTRQQIQQAALHPEYTTDMDGCKQCLREHGSPQSMVCIATDDAHAWIRIGYTIVRHRNAPGPHMNALPWGTGAPAEFQDFARNEKHCSQEILEYLNQHVDPPANNVPQTATKEAVRRNSRNGGTAVAEQAAPGEAPNGNLAMLRNILRRNFDLFRKVYEDIYHCDFGSRPEHVQMFYRNREDIQAVQQWNSNEVHGVGALIDPCAFNEAFLGNTVDPDILILGKNPGADGIDAILTEDMLQHRFSEMDDRLQCKKNLIFYPLWNTMVMNDLPWFANRLIFGLGSNSAANWKKQGQNGILSRFIGGNPANACNYAGRIASVELVPYHTGNFAKKAKLQKKFGVFGDVSKIVKRAMGRGAIILCPYYGAVNMWTSGIDGLLEYQYAFTSTGAINGWMHIESLRRFDRFATPREADENCDTLFARLEQLGWKRR